MRFTKRFTAVLLTLTLMLGMAPEQPINAYAADAAPSVTLPVHTEALAQTGNEASQIGNEFINCFVDPDTGKFQILPATKTMQDEYRSSAIFRIDGTEYEFGGHYENAGTALSPTHLDGGRLITGWKIKDYIINQIQMIVEDESNANASSIYVYYDIIYTGNKASDISMRLLIDAPINQQDGAAVMLDDDSRFIQESAYSGASVPNYFRLAGGTLQDVENHEAKAYGVTRQGNDLSVPEKVIFANYLNVADGGYDYEPDAALCTAPNACVLYYFDGIKLDGNQSRAIQVGTIFGYYGFSPAPGSGFEITSAVQGVSPNYQVTSPGGLNVAPTAITRLETGQGFTDESGAFQYVVLQDINHVELKRYNSYVFGTSVTAVEVPAQVTYNEFNYFVTAIADNAFDNCQYLTSITISDNVTSIGDHAFDYCIALKSITLPQTNPFTLGKNAFERCNSLETIVFPKYITSIGEQAFNMCIRLTKVVFLGNTVPTFGSSIFNNVPNPIQVYAPSAAIADYTTALANQLTPDSPSILDANFKVTVPPGHYHMDKGATKPQYMYGEVVTVRLESPEAGYTFMRWSSPNPSVVFKDIYAAETTFVMPAEDVEIIPVVQQGGVQSYPVTVKIKNGSVNYYHPFGHSINYVAGESVLLDVIPDVLYSFSDCSIDAADVEIRGSLDPNQNGRGSVAFTMPAKPVTVYINLRQINGNGTIMFYERTDSNQPYSISYSGGYSPNVGRLDVPANTEVIITYDNLLKSGNAVESFVVRDLKNKDGTGSYVTIPSKVERDHISYSFIMPVPATDVAVYADIAPYHQLIPHDIYLRPLGNTFGVKVRSLRACTESDLPISSAMAGETVCIFDDFLPESGETESNWKLPAGVTVPVEVVASDGTKIGVTRYANTNRYLFTMPADNVTVRLLYNDDNRINNAAVLEFQKGPRPLEEFQLEQPVLYITDDNGNKVNGARPHAGLYVSLPTERFVSYADSNITDGSPNIYRLTNPSFAVNERHRGVNIFATLVNKRICFSTYSDDADVKVTWQADPNFMKTGKLNIINDYADQAKVTVQPGDGYTSNYKISLIGGDLQHVYSLKTSSGTISEIGLNYDNAALAAGYANKTYALKGNGDGDIDITVVQTERPAIPLIDKVYYESNSSKNKFYTPVTFTGSGLNMQDIVYELTSKADGYADYATTHTTKDSGSLSVEVRTLIDRSTFTPTALPSVRTVTVRCYFRNDPQTKYELATFSFNFQPVLNEFVPKENEYYGILFGTGVPSNCNNLTDITKYMNYSSAITSVICDTGFSYIKEGLRFSGSNYNYTCDYMVSKNKDGVSPSNVQLGPYLNISVPQDGWFNVNSATKRAYMTNVTLSTPDGVLYKMQDGDAPIEINMSNPPQFGFPRPIKFVLNSIFSADIDYVRIYRDKLSFDGTLNFRMVKIGALGGIPTSAHVTELVYSADGNGKYSYRGVRANGTLIDFPPVLSLLNWGNGSNIDIDTLDPSPYYRIRGGINLNFIKYAAKFAADIDLGTTDSGQLVPDNLSFTIGGSPGVEIAPGVRLKEGGGSMNNLRGLFNGDFVLVPQSTLSLFTKLNFAEVIDATVAGSIGVGYFKVSSNGAINVKGVGFSFIDYMATEYGAREVITDKFPSNNGKANALDIGIGNNIRVTVIPAFKVIVGKGEGRVGAYVGIGSSSSVYAYFDFSIDAEIQIPRFGITLGWGPASYTVYFGPYTIAHFNAHMNERSVSASVGIEGIVEVSISYNYRDNKGPSFGFDLFSLDPTSLEQKVPLYNDLGIQIGEAKIGGNLHYVCSSGDSEQQQAFPVNQMIQATGFIAAGGTPEPTISTSLDEITHTISIPSGYGTVAVTADLPAEELTVFDPLGMPYPLYTVGGADANGQPVEIGDGVEYNAMSGSTLDGKKTTMILLKTDGEWIVSGSRPFTSTVIKVDPIPSIESFAYDSNSNTLSYKLSGLNSAKEYYVRMGISPKDASGSLTQTNDVYEKSITGSIISQGGFTDSLVLDMNALREVLQSGEYFSYIYFYKKDGSIPVDPDYGAMSQMVVLEKADDRNAIILQNPNAPAAVTGVGLTGAGNGVLKLSFSESQNADGYTVNLFDVNTDSGSEVLTPSQVTSGEDNVANAVYDVSAGLAENGAFNLMLAGLSPGRKYKAEVIPYINRQNNYTDSDGLTQTAESRLYGGNALSPTAMLNVPQYPIIGVLNANKTSEGYERLLNSDGGKIEINTDSACTIKLYSINLTDDLTANPAAVSHIQVAAASSADKLVYSVPPENLHDGLYIAEAINSSGDSSMASIVMRYNDTPPSLSLDYVANNGDKTITTDASGNFVIVGKTSAGFTVTAMGPNGNVISAVADVDGMFAINGRINTSGGSEDYTVSVVDAYGNTTLNTVTVIRGNSSSGDLPSGGDNGGSSNGGGASASKPTPAPTLPASNVIVDGKEVSAGTVKTSGDVTTVTVNQDILKKLLETATGNVTAIIPTGTGTGVAELIVENVEDMAAKGMSLTIQFGDVKYNIPATAIDTAALLAALGAENAADVPLSITITTNMNAAALAAVKSALNASGGELVFPPMEFKITATYNNKTVEIDTFGQYITRTIEITEEQAQRITTAVIVEPDGTIRHVPTRVYQNDGKWYAEASSLTNSIYAFINNEKIFTDAKGKWYERTVGEMASRKVISGVGNNMFDGERDITRAEFAAIVIRALGLPASGKVAVFTDVSHSAWYCGVVGAAYEHGLVSGVGGNQFAPDRKITRQEAMLMIQRAAKIAAFNGSEGNLNTFTDAGNVSAWALEAALWNVGSGLVVGSDGKIRPLDNITRAETATLVLKLLQKAGLVDVRTPLK